MALQEISTEFSPETLKTRKNLEDLSADGRNILKGEVM
jgi:hypothetical protein